MQGVILPADCSKSSLAGITIGHLDERAKTVTARIGNHSMMGEVVVLKKPLILIQKRLHGDSAVGISAETCDVTEYEVAGVIKRKLLFDIRPQPIIGSGAMLQ